MREVATVFFGRCVKCLIDDSNNSWVSVRSVCDNIGLTYTHQCNSIVDYEDGMGGITHLTHLGELYVDLESIGTWLDSSIDRRRLSSNIRKYIEIYLEFLYFDLNVSLVDIFKANVSSLFVHHCETLFVNYDPDLEDLIDRAVRKDDSTKEAMWLNLIKDYNIISAKNPKVELSIRLKDLLDIPLTPKEEKYRAKTFAFLYFAEELRRRQQLTTDKQQ